MISIIVPVSKGEQILNLLQALVKQNLDAAKFEVILVFDQGWTFDIQEMPFAVHAVESINRHAAFKRNLGVTESTGDVLVFFDDDVVPNPDWLKNAENLLSSKKAHVLNGTDFKTSKSLKVYIAEILKNHPFSEGTWRRLTTGNRLVGCLSVSLCNAAFSREVWSQVGGFNADIDFTMDDTEFFYLCQMRGYRIMKCPGLAVEHDRPPMVRPYLNHRFTRRMAVGMNTVLFPQLFLRTNAVRVVLASYVAVPFLVFSLWKTPLVTVCALGILWAIPALFFSLPLALKDPRFLLLMPPAFFATQAVSYVGFSLGLFRGLLHFRDLAALRTSQRERWKTTNSPDPETQGAG